MTSAPAQNRLSQDQRRAIAYVKANGGVTTRDAALALQRSRQGMLSTLQLLEGRGIVRCVWPNRPGHDSWEWYFVEDPTDA